MKDIYICFTLYHLMITILKIDTSKNNVLVLMDSIYNAENLKDDILKLKIFKNIYVLKDRKYYSKFPIYSNSVKSELNFLKSNNVYIFNDYSFIGEFLHRNKIKYHLIEDGYNSFKYDFLNPSDSFYYKLKCFFLNKTKFKGYSRFCIDIEVNDLNDLPSDNRNNKFLELPRKVLFEKQYNDKKNIIDNIFNVHNVSLEENSILILTQPLFKDGLVESEDEQFAIYNDVCNTYKNNFKIYIKVHPRDNVDYLKISDVKILDRKFPIEILSFSSNLKFKKGITYSSSALEFIDFVEEKIFINEFKKIVDRR
ncbi:MAG: glycosyltransferase family 52 protein [Erysipelotrichaceae bacterium]|nr:glycosyltransferase family 52 protein [Erysipelotrichaceae bacterium]